MVAGMQGHEVKWVISQNHEREKGRERENQYVVKKNMHAKKSHQSWEE